MACSNGRIYHHLHQWTTHKHPQPNCILISTRRGQCVSGHTPPIIYIGCLSVYLCGALSPHTEVESAWSLWVNRLEVCQPSMSSVNEWPCLRCHQLCILSIHPSPTHPPAWKIFEFYESNLKFHNKPNLASLLKILQKLRRTQCNIKALLNGIGNHLKLVRNIATVTIVLDAVTYSLQNLSALTTITIVCNSNIFINAITDKTTKLKINIYSNWQQMHDDCCITQTA